MTGRFLALAGAFILFLANGCATGGLSGGAGQVSGPLRAIEFYTKLPQWEELYPTAARERLFASDAEVYVVSYWDLPGPGLYASKVVLRTPAGAIHGLDVANFRAEAPRVATRQRIRLPQGDEAQSLGGRWEVEVALDGASVGRRSFTFDPGGIRLRTDARLLIVQGKGDPETLVGDWIWRDQAAIIENAKAALRMLGIAFRDELARRFPHVEGPRSSFGEADATVLLTPTLSLSPDINVESRLDLEVVYSPTKTVRKFHLETAAGSERFGGGGRLNFAVAAGDLAIRAASSRELLEFLITATQAAPE